MKDISNKLFLCYAWEDIAKIQSIQKEIEDELYSKISPRIDASNCVNFGEATTKKIEDSEVFVVFISESSKKSDYVKSCVTYALNLNKNILPIEIEKLSRFSSNPKEFKFRSKPYSFVEKNSKAMLFAQLKASLGFNVESGDGFGALIHVVTDRDASITRYGEQLGIAKAGEDHRIRLKKGSHLLTFVDIEDPNLTYSTTYKVENNDSELFLEVPLGKLFMEKQQKEDKEKREAEIKRKFEEENYQKNLLLEQKRRELELKQREEELAKQQQQNSESTYSTRCVDDNINFFSAIRICLIQKYATFKGRASRSEFWYFILFSYISIGFSAGMVDIVLGIIWFVLLIPTLAAVSVRRLHDIGMSGWCWIVVFIPYLGWLILLYLLCKASDKYPNDYDDTISGTGKKVYNDGSSYNGSWSNGKYNGKGTKRFANGIEYDSNASNASQNIVNNAIPDITDVVRKCCYQFYEEPLGDPNYPSYTVRCNVRWTDLVNNLNSTYHLDLTKEEYSVRNYEFGDSEINYENLISHCRKAICLAQASDIVESCFTRQNVNPMYLTEHVINVDKLIYKLRKAYGVSMEAWQLLDSGVSPTVSLKKIVDVSIAKIPEERMILSQNMLRLIVCE